MDMPEGLGRRRRETSGIAAGLMAFLFCLPLAFLITAANQIDIGDLNADQVLVVLSMAIAVALWLYALLRTGFHPLLSMHCFASVWLIFVPALHHLETGIFPAFNLSYASATLSMAAVICVVHGLFFALGYLSTNNRAVYRGPGFVPSASSVLVVVVGLNLAAWSFIALNGPALYLAMRQDGDAVFSSSFAAVINFTLARSIVMAALLIGVYALCRLRKVMPLALSLPAAFILLAPQSTPRVQILSVALAIVMLCVDLRARLYKLLFPVLAFFGLVTVLPLLSQVSRGEDGNGGLERIYQSMDFAQFQSIAIAAQFHLQQGLTWGAQLAGAMLFFVPRQIWPDKPVTTAEMVSSAAGMWFTNISMPIAAELFIDFGFIGLALLSGLLGWAARGFDDRYDAADHRHSFRIVYYAVVFATFGMVVRGSLGAVLPFVIFPLVILYVSERLMIAITRFGWTAPRAALPGHE